jgi:hypothetical protein
MAGTHEGPAPAPCQRTARNGALKLRASLGVRAGSPAPNNMAANKWRILRMMRTALRTTVGFCFFSILIGPLAAHATTVIVKLESDRIILVADTRRNTLGKFSNPTTEHIFHDDVCKIVPLGKIGFAMTGYKDYRRAEDGDMVGDWNADEDARASYSSHADNLSELVNDWGRRAMQHYLAFYYVAPVRVSSVA